MLVAVSVYLVLFQFYRPFGWDEMEHIHASFLVSQGLIPYKDFFEHHHPVLWYLLAPLMLIPADISIVLVIVKLFGLILGASNLTLVFLIIKKIVPDKVLAAVAITVISISPVFQLNGMELRPDTLMMLCILLSLYALLHKKLVLAVFLISCSVVILQKAMFFLPFFAPVFFLEIKKILQPRLLLKCVVAFLLPVYMFLAYIAYNGIWNDYFFYNWTLNFAFKDTFSPWRTISEINVYFCILAIVGIIYTGFLYIKDRNIRLLAVLWLCLASCMFILVARSPYSQYFLPFVFSVGLPVALVIRRIQNKFTVLIGICVASFYIFFPTLPFGSDYIFINQVAEFKRINALPVEEKRKLPVQHGRNLFFVQKEYYWFSPEAQETVHELNSR